MISVVNENGDEFFPFGSDKKNNLILDQGLDILAESKYYCAFNGINYNTIGAFLYALPVLGDGTTPATNSDTILEHQLQEASSIKSGSCSCQDNLITGSRTFKKIYDFPQPTSAITVSELGMRTPFNGTKLFSRFLLDAPINVQPGQYIRLYYDFTVTIDAIVNPISITASSGTVTADGYLKLCGLFDNIFQGIDSDGNPNIIFGDSPRTSILPYYDKFCTEDPACSTTCFGTAYMMEANSAMPSTNVSMSNQWIGTRLSSDLESISASTYINGNFYRDITYTFANNNPSFSQLFGGFLFTVTKSNRQNTWDGWFWKFNTNQTKLNTKQLVITLRQSVSRA